ncbi:MAG TPA: undecaprenyldiphospho-muramoylpentapeptide beta-N-acetylglucosaminyltransferase, partial [Nitrospirae bacterium]|nr:undecaprenyldiphospho-muramoylpentapeptide beta-N-acetylglucosaminyltransferase [Nitrospirota bacterium]HEW81717.1 undecaprenyldiphospho-muramoylpentapeptide beta-N-acetylglucosaminyltransferase [Nitrospirota bacterium]
VTFVGTVRGIEAKIIPREGYDLRFIRSEGLVGRDIIDTVRAALKVPLSIMDSFRILKDIRPELVMGVGGYSSGPVLLCAKLMGIPTLIHEQNTVPGLANKLLGKLVDTVAVTYHESIKYFPREKVFLTGNPVREEILNGDRDNGCEVFSLDRKLFTIFIFGGSRGASHINNAVAEALTYLEPLKENIQFLHQTGEKDFDVMKEIYSSKGFKGTVIPFAYQMADAYSVAELIISRAGATTLAELTACGKAAILVPFPYSAGNHQEMNARKLWDMGAAQLILDRDLDGKKLFDMIKFLIEDSDALSEMERISRSLGNRGATDKVIELITALLKKKR